SPLDPAPSTTTRRLAIQRRGRDLNPRRTFQHVRDFQSRSLGRSDTSPRGDSLARRGARQPWVTEDTYAATSSICSSVSVSLNGGIPPPPFVTWVTTLS